MRVKVGGIPLPKKWRNSYLVKCFSVTKEVQSMGFTQNLRTGITILMIIVHFELILKSLFENIGYTNGPIS